ncbi:transposase [Pseudovibrio japonicus]|uniref:transposase n=1 Tax=Pseudovibrio japonicus TaxID=366534 RepID=UPI0016783698|nr:transposase [Pseudovibrio japonicus]
MARGRKLNEIKDFQRSLRNKYGLGEGASYKPWIRVQDIPSHGTCSKIWGMKTQREHHLLSNNESAFSISASTMSALLIFVSNFRFFP